LREIERAREEVAWETHRGHTRVSVGVSPAASSLLMPGALSHLHSRFPQVRPALIEALYPRSLAMVRSGEIEIAVGPLPMPRPDHDLATQVLFDGDTTMVVRSGSKYADARQIADLAEAPWVLTGPVDGPGDPRCLDYGDKMIASPTIVLECESIATLLAVLPSIDALALVPSGFHERYGQYAGLKKIDVAQALPKVTLHAAWRANVPLTIPAQALLDAFKHEALGYSK
jgi:DNA-binding transcriptional LysR family regulator